MKLRRIAEKDAKMQEMQRKHEAEVSKQKKSHVGTWTYGHTGDLQAAGSSTNN